ncbi:hypothetical protein [Photorhabdus asymbiotica]|uniref:nSTAND3 domain-containing NTPase n=1 Tax=Photorhabdus asymbiotica TaxID=291112 RepID=UPI003DA77FCC
MLNCPNVRHYIYLQSCATEPKTGTFPLLSESQAIIDIHDLSESKKQQILYKHLK